MEEVYAEISAGTGTPVGVAYILQYGVLEILTPVRVVSTT
jgi:hypothetical protein